MNREGRGPLIHGAGEGEVIEARGSRVVIKVAGASQLICEYSAPAHFPGPPLHIHPGFDETFLVQSGRIELITEDGAVELGPGASAHVPGGIPHTFRNPDAERASFLLVCCPGGFEHYFRAIATDDLDMLQAITERFGYEVTDQAAAPAGGGR